MSVAMAKRPAVDPIAKVLNHGYLDVRQVAEFSASRFGPCTTTTRPGVFLQQTPSSSVAHYGNERRSSSTQRSSEAMHACTERKRRRRRDFLN
jgi:hypothetical protein